MREPTKLLIAYDLLVNVQVTTAATIPAVVKEERGLSILNINALNQSQPV